ncbi:MAG: phenylalanine 4-monooxygenase [Paracoccaceae bacterium]
MGKTSSYKAKIPDQSGNICYSPSENEVWRDLYLEQLPQIRKYSAREFLTGFDKIDLPKDRVPQCSEVSEVLLDLTGWRVVPVPALIGFAEFFGMLANREFPAASFIRARQDFDYIEEPDIFHEIFGHTPLLTDPRFARFSQAIGQAGLRAGAKDYAWLIRLYWFTVEFGLTKTDGVIRALGSGLASSPSELEYSVNSDIAQRRAFDVMDILRTPYRIDIHQPIYFVLDDVDDLFRAAERDLLQDVRQAQSLGLFEPTYPTKKSA